MSDKILDIEIYHDSCYIVAHLEGSKDPLECKTEIMDLLEISLSICWKVNGQSHSNLILMTLMPN